MRRLYESNLPLLIRHPLAFARRYRWPLVVLAVGSVLDVLTTVWNMYRFGVGIELHLPQRLLATWLGPAWGIAVSKTVQVLGALFVAALWRPWCGWLMLLAGTLYALAAVSNYFLWL